MTDEPRHRGKIVSGYIPLKDASAPAFEGPKRRKRFGWECSCGAMSTVSFPSAREAENNHDEHMLAAIGD